MSEKKMSKISLVVKHAVTEGFPIAHILLEKTNDVGEKFIIRGGPEFDTFWNFGRLIMEVDVQSDDSEDREETNELYRRITLDFDHMNDDTAWAEKRLGVRETNF